MTIISHGKQTPLRGKLWRDWSSTNKKKKCSTSHFSLGRWRCFCRRHVCRTCYAVDRELSYPLEAKVSRFLSQGILQMVGDSNGHWTLRLHLNLVKLLFFSETAQKKIMGKCLSSHDAVVIWNRGWEKMARNFQNKSQILKQNNINCVFSVFWREISVIKRIAFRCVVNKPVGIVQIIRVGDGLVSRV